MCAALIISRVSLGVIHLLLTLNFSIFFLPFINLWRINFSVNCKPSNLIMPLSFCPQHYECTLHNMTLINVFVALYAQYSVLAQSSRYPYMCVQRMCIHNFIVSIYI